MEIKLIFAWYDFWIGFFWDRKQKVLYVFPIPMFGVCITFYGKRCYVLRKNGMYYRPKAEGYTFLLKNAGRFTLEEALRHEYPYDTPVTKHHIKDMFENHENWN